MITKNDFTDKLKKWLSEETCEKLADEAEMSFAETETESCYELMLVLMCSGDEDDFRDLLASRSIEPQDDDNIEDMFEDMAYEW